MRWLVVLVLIGGVYSNSTNVTNVTCSNGLCSNNTCSWGYYNTTYECSICNKLRDQYREESCCHLYSNIPNPSSEEYIVNSTYENDTGTVLIKYTPPRPICHHLWTEWGKCPPICDNIPSGDYCSMDIDCKNSNLCLNNFCCAIRYDNCNSCANGTGYCDSCMIGMAFNATGNSKCGYCPSWTYTTDNACHPYSNCTEGFYIAINATLTNDRECSAVAHGYFTNQTNAFVPMPWSTCSNSTWSYFSGNSTHDLVCKNHTVCENQTISQGNLTHDTVCNATF